MMDAALAKWFQKVQKRGVIRAFASLPFFIPDS